LLKFLLDELFECHILLSLARKALGIQVYSALARAGGAMAIAAARACGREKNEADGEKEDCTQYILQKTI